MKKTKTPILIIFFFLLVCATYLFFNPMVGKLLLGSARFIEQEIKSDIYINGKKNTDARLFFSDSNFEEDKKRDYFILYLRDVKNHEGFPVLIIDRENRTVRIPNASINDYAIFFGKLLQSESGAHVMIPVNDAVKGPGFEPELKINGKLIEFRMIENGAIIKIKVHIA